MPKPKPKKYRIILRESGLEDALEVRSFDHLADALVAQKVAKDFARRRNFAGRILIAKADAAGVLHIIDTGD